MRFSVSLSFALLAASSAFAAPTRRQVAQMDLSPQVIATAGGGPPDTAPPSTLSPATLNAFQVANFLENLESDFFQNGVTNLKKWEAPATTVEIVSMVAAQEQVHVATFEALLTHFSTFTIPPCTYSFPYNTTAQFLQLAQIITSVGIGAVIDLAANVVVDDPALLQNIASTVTVEARHDAFFRGAAAGLAPNPTPQDTRISAVWALNLAMPFVNNGSCPLMPVFDAYPSLNVVTAPTITATGAGNATISFEVPAVDFANDTWYIGWVNQANVPLYTNITVSAETITTNVPPGMGGLAFVVLTDQNGALDVERLTAATVAGPAVVQIS